MPEDALVQIFERPAIWNDHRFGRSIARCVLDLRRSGRYRLNFQDLVRMVLRSLRQDMPFTSFTSLTASELQDAIDRTAQRSASHLVGET